MFTEMAKALISLNLDQFPHQSSWGHLVFVGLNLV